MKYFLGMEISGSFVRLLVADAAGAIVARRSQPVDRQGGAAGIKRQVELLLSELKTQQYAFTAAGVGFGGPVDWKRGNVIRSHQIEGWDGFDLAEWLENLLRCPVLVENDANVAALAEAVQGAGKGYETVFSISINSGIGGGLVQNGRLYHGAIPGESEVGHLRLSATGPTLEEAASGWAVEERLQQLAAADPALGRLLAPHDTVLNGFAAAVAAGHGPAVNFMNELAQWLAFGLSHVVHLFHPELLVVGGELPGALGERLLAGIRSALPALLMEAFRPGPAVVEAQLGEEDAPLGALLMARNTLGNRYAQD